MNKKDFLILSIILILAVVARVYKINIPLAEYNSEYQVNVAAVGRNFMTEGFNLLEPKYDNLSTTTSGQENPEGYRFAEFPLYSAIPAFFFKYLPITTFEIYARSTTIFFSLVIISLLYYFGIKEHSRSAGIFVALIYSFMPYFVFYSRVILPDTMALAHMLISIWALYLYFNSKARHHMLFAMSIIFYALALLIQPLTFFYSIVIGYLFISNYRFDLFKHWQLYVFPLLGIIPFALWRVYMLQFPEGIPESTGLIATIQNNGTSENIFFHSEYLKVMFMDRLGNAMMGIYLICFFVIGFIGKYRKNLHLSFLLTALLMIFLLQAGNFQFEFFQTLLLPAFAFVTAIGIGHTISHKNNFNKIILYPSLFIIFALSFFISYTRVRNYYNYPSELTQIAKLITTFTSPEDKIVTDTDGDATLLYLSERKGAASIYTSISELKKMGYSYLVTDEETLTKELRKKELEVLVENQRFSIIRL